MPDDTTNTGKKVRTNTEVIGANTVHEHYMFVMYDEAGTPTVVNLAQGLPIQGSVSFTYSISGFTSSPTHATVSLPDNTNTTVLASPGILNRKMFLIQNPNATTVWIKLDGAAAVVGDGIMLPAWQSLSVTYPDFISQSIIKGIQNSGGAVNVNVTYIHES